MTPMEAWSIVAPILAAHSIGVGYDDKLNPLDRAYVIVYGALKRLEEEQKKETQ